MEDNMTPILDVLADMEAFARSGDSLSRLIGEEPDGELHDDELELISAAGGEQSYAAFLRRLSEETQGR